LNKKDLANADEILHFVQNDTLFFGKERLIVMKTAEGVFERVLIILLKIKRQKVISDRKLMKN